MGAVLAAFVPQGLSDHLQLVYLPAWDLADQEGSPSKSTPIEVASDTRLSPGRLGIELAGQWGLEKSS